MAKQRGGGAAEGGADSCGSGARQSQFQEELQEFRGWVLGRPSGQVGGAVLAPALLPWGLHPQSDACVQIHLLDALARYGAIPTAVLEQALKGGRAGAAWGRTSPNCPDTLKAACLCCSLQTWWRRAC